MTDPNEPRVIPLTVNVDPSKVADQLLELGNRVAEGRASDQARAEFCKLVSEAIRLSDLAGRDFASEADLGIDRLEMIEAGLTRPTADEVMSLWAAANWRDFVFPHRRVS